MESIRLSVAATCGSGKRRRVASFSRGLDILLESHSHHEHEGHRLIDTSPGTITLLRRSTLPFPMQAFITTSSREEGDSSSKGGRMSRQLKLDGCVQFYFVVIRASLQ